MARLFFWLSLLQALGYWLMPLIVWLCERGQEEDWRFAGDKLIYRS